MRVPAGKQLHLGREMSYVKNRHLRRHDHDAGRSFLTSVAHAHWPSSATP